MSSRKQVAPPRPLTTGDVVTAYSMDLGEWTAAQIIRLDAEAQTAAVLELDWSGPEPSAVADLGDIAPLRLTHHSWNGTLSCCNHEWVLPRSHKVVGAVPLLHDGPADSWASEWRLGDQLARQRRWDSGVDEDPLVPWKAEYTGEAVNEFLSQPAAPRSEIKQLTISDIDSLDCGRLVQRFPALIELYLYGRLGLLSAADGLNELISLRRIHIVDLFGMTKEDRLTPRRVPELESVFLQGIPAEYASAMRTTWRPEIPAGTSVSIYDARKPEWVEENRNNPLRDWDGRDQISTATYKRAVAQFKMTRKAILEALAEEPADVRSIRMEEIGRAYGEAFNRLDRRSGFIETVEREELFAALDHIMDEAEALHGPGLGDARDGLVSGVESVRDW
ncbi:hypothetical protein [Sphaerimonospora thailandensis]|uniref:Uncharacterized protein n=1 Tax=Sphaerimonospora thailandensis TaxID=795644 RepID=A0A8J3RGI1_9ACTN|nr:hypothetical protein [Sphaerimonospora thailandensis]GIH73452.1 hypothetical protein Mth01_57050 [Sphaerimonospora thailandensis]